jgi:hypothetical protein
MMLAFDGVDYTKIGSLDTLFSFFSGKWVISRADFAREDLGRTEAIAVKCAGDGLNDDLPAFIDAGFDFDRLPWAGSGAIGSFQDTLGAVIGPGKAYGAIVTRKDLEAGQRCHQQGGVLNGDGGGSVHEHDVKAGIVELDGEGLIGLGFGIGDDGQSDGFEALASGKIYGATSGLVIGTFGGGAFHQAKIDRGALAELTGADDPDDEVCLIFPDDKRGSFKIDVGGCVIAANDDRAMARRAEGT